MQIKSHNYFVYIMSSFTKVLYIGVTNSLERRIFEHKNELVEGFTKKYRCKKLVYFEEYSQIEEAIQREKQIKGWVRKRKVELIQNFNPGWKDLSVNFVEDPSLRSG